MLIIAPPAVSQNTSATARKAMAYKAIQDLKAGTLYVRLPSHRKKIEALEQMLADDNLKDSQAKYLERQLDDAIEERDRLALGYAAAFDSLYQFSNYALLYDYESPKLNAGAAEVYDSNFKKIGMDMTRPYFILHIGQTAGTAVEALTILDKEMRPLPSPFPANIVRYGPLSFLNFLVNKQDLFRHVRRLEKRLIRFHEKVLLEQNDMGT